ncbi:MAG: MFS transporter [Bauldia sp.]|uniref:MFS transporter n=1 Tax=Bauldia sp. TaxID=2575872 RepID=UPI001DBEEA28|nr:MFS transporter [Bauldia sp.]MCB1497456.1 MFS transporter [Bauldia sp.]
MPDRILLPLIVACALFMENLDATVLSTALPAIAKDFDANPIHLKLALTSYLLAIAIFIPASGWLADRHGARLVFRLAILTFVTGSILCGLSSSIPEIVAARIVQGIGGSMMVPVGRLVILRSIDKRDLVGSLAWLTVPALIGPVMGPPVGGFITTYFEWRWIFWINVPVGVLGLVLATLYIPDIRGADRPRFDARGFALAGLGLALFMSGSTTLGLDLLPLGYVFAMLAGGGALLLAYIAHSRRVAAPIIDLSLFRIHTFRTSMVGTMLFRIGVGATPFLLPLLLQLGFGMTPFRSGMITFAAAIGALAMKFAAPPILRRHGFRSVLVVNAVVAGLFVMLPAAFVPTTPVWLMTGLLLVGGFFRSLQFTSVNALAFADIPPDRMSRATTMTSVAQQLALSIGISVGAIMVQLTSAATGGEIAASSFWPAFLVVGMLTTASTVPFMRLAHDAGHEMSGHRRYAPDAVTTMRER